MEVYRNVRGTAVKLDASKFNSNLSSNDVNVQIAMETIDQMVGGGGIPDAPVDGNQYARQNAAWSVVSATGGGAGQVDGGFANAVYGGTSAIDGGTA